MKKLLPVLIVLLIAAVRVCVLNSVEEPADALNSSVEELASPVLKLEGNPSTGYSWQVQILQEDEVLRVQQDYTPCFAASHEGEIMPPGTGGTYTYLLQGLQAGEATLVLRYCRVWEDGEPLRTVTCQVQVDKSGNVTILACSFH